MKNSILKFVFTLMYKALLITLLAIIALTVGESEKSDVPIFVISILAYIFLFFSMLYDEKYYN